jgi:hypothetical protein
MCISQRSCVIIFGSCESQHPWYVYSKYDDDLGDGEGIRWSKRINITLLYK